MVRPFSFLRPSQAGQDWQTRAWQQESHQGLNQFYVNDVFYKVAGRYDIMNDVLSAGSHRLWKRLMVSSLALPGKRASEVLDLAGGTGDIAKLIVRGWSKSQVTVCDINSAMLTVGRTRAEREGWSERVDFVEGNAESPPFEDGRFDAITIAFGIRNVPDRQKALGEVFRLLRPGGQFICLEFSPVVMPGLDRFYDAYGRYVIPGLGRLIAGSGEPYAYLVESIKRFPEPSDFGQELTDAGLSRLSIKSLTGGIAALHMAWKL